MGRVARVLGQAGEAVERFQWVQLLHYPSLERYVGSGAYILEVNHIVMTVTDRPDKGGRNEPTGFEPVHENLINKCG